MPIDNNVSIQKNNSNISNKNTKNKTQKYHINPNGVDKTPQKDTIQLSTVKKVGLVAGILTTAVGLYFLVRGKKPPKNVTNTVKNITEEATEVIQKSTPKMEMTEEAKKIYNNADKVLHKQITTTAQTVENNLAPKAKKGSWDSKEMKEYYTQLEKESDAKLFAEKIAKEAEIKKLKELENKALKELETFKTQLPEKTPRELSQLQYDFCWNKRMRELERQAHNSGWDRNTKDINEYLSPTEAMEYKTITDKYKLVNEQIRKNKEKVAHLKPNVFEGSDVPMHHYLNGNNTNVREAVELQEQLAKGEVLTAEDKAFVEKMNKYMDKVDTSFENLKPLEKRCVGYRGRTENPLFKSANKDFDIVDKAKVGDVIVPDKGYSYAAFDRSLADNWGGPGAVMTDRHGKPTRQIMYTMYYPEGAKVSCNLEHGGEIVAPRGAAYKVLSKETDKQGNIEIAMEYILPNSK